MNKIKIIRLFTTFLLSTSFFLTLFGQELNTENGLTSIVEIDKKTHDGGVSLEMSFLTDVTYPIEIDWELTKYVYGHGGSMKDAVYSYASKAIKNRKLLSKYNVNWVFCMAYQQNRFYSYVNFQTPNIYALDTLTMLMQCGVIDMQIKKRLEVKDIFTDKWLDEHKKLKKETDRILILPDWTIVLMSSLFIDDFKVTSQDGKVSLAILERFIKNNLKKYGYWLKTFNLAEMKDCLKPSFLELIDWDSTPIAVEPHVYDDAKAQRIAEDLRDRIVIEERDIDDSPADVTAREATPRAEEAGSDGEKVFDVVEQMPEFLGGQAALMKWLSDNVKYPAIAEENGIQGRVVCTFIVERDGSVTDVQVARSIDPSLDKEAVRVLKKMPKWNPGKQNGKAVRVKYTVPVTFRLNMPAPTKKITTPIR